MALFILLKEKDINDIKKSSEEMYEIILECTKKWLLQ